ncbi:MAG TPA: ABC transporter permease [Thermoanaerobaculia bacterium]|nr:ABC transporter permease [Thermoanaerobaculia bacterium]
MQRHLFLLRELVHRDFEARYAGSLLGFLWSLLQPLWQLLLYGFVFSTVMRVPLTGERTSSFAVFLFCGLLPWTAVHEGVLRGSTAITDNAPLVKKLRFPSQLLVATVVLSGLLHAAIGGVLFAAILAVRGELSWASLGWLLLAIPLQLALTFGLALVLAALHVFFRDIAQILGMVFMGWFYLTPIVYPLGLVPSTFRPWVEHNPLTALVALYRSAFLGRGGAGVPGLATLALTAVLLLGLGWWLFRRLQPSFVDEL